MREGFGRALGAVVMAATLVLPGCGGGSDLDDLAGTAPPMHFAPAITPVQLFHWAEQRFPTLFPAPGEEVVLVASNGVPVVYRRYTATRNYVIVAEGVVYVAGPVAGGAGEVAEVGPLEAFARIVGGG